MATELTGNTGATGSHEFDTTNYNPDEMDKIINEHKQEAYTNYKNFIKFPDRESEFIFNHLPLNELQKEELVMSQNEKLYKHYQKIKELKKLEKEKRNECKDRLSPVEDKNLFDIKRDIGEELDN